jgi:hypothetical protein
VLESLELPAQSFVCRFSTARARSLTFAFAVALIAKILTGKTWPLNTLGEVLMTRIGAEK